MSRLFAVTVMKEEDWFVAKCLENNVASQGKTMDESMNPWMISVRQLHYTMKKNLFLFFLNPKLT